MTKEEMIQMFSDIHKDAYGFRPRFDFHSLNTDELTQWYDTFDREIEESNISEAAMEKQAIADFEQSIKETIKYGASDEDEALRWLVGSELDLDDVYSKQDIEHYVWGLGLLFTDYGRNLVKRIECFVTQSMKIGVL